MSSGKNHTKPSQLLEPGFGSLVLPIPVISTDSEGKGNQYSTNAPLWKVGPVPDSKQFKPGTMAGTSSWLATVGASVDDFSQKKCPDLTAFLLALKEVL